MVTMEADISLELDKEGELVTMETDLSQISRSYKTGLREFSHCDFMQVLQKCW